MTQQIKVLVKEPGKAPSVKEISNTLHDMQALVGGYIKTFPLDEDNIIISNAEGKIENLAPNMRIFVPNEVDEFIYGPFLVAGYNMHEQDFASITEESIKKCETIFEH